MDQSFSLAGRRILVTGAASGMGRSFAGLAAADDAHVGLLDMNAAGLDETVSSLGGSGVHAAVAVDLSDWGATEAAVAELRMALGGFDAICNIAGWDAPGRFWDQPYEMWQKLIAVNLWSCLHVCRAAVPDLVEQESGTIVNVASDAGRVGSKGETIYAAAKGGVMAFTKSAARELAPHKVTVNCICPGPTVDAAARAGAGRQPEADREARARDPAASRRRPDRPGAGDRRSSRRRPPATAPGRSCRVSGGLTMVG